MMPQDPETVFESDEISVKLLGEELLIEPRQPAVLAGESARAAMKLSYLQVRVARIFAAADYGGHLAILGCFHDRYSSGTQSGVQLRIGPLAAKQARAAAAALRSRLGLPRTPKPVAPGDLTTLPPGEHWVEVTGTRGPKGHLEAPDFEGAHLRTPIGVADLRGRIVVQGVLVVPSRSGPMAFGVERRELLAFMMSSAPPPGIDETPLTQLFDEFRAMTFSSWSLRLLSPDRIEGLCGQVLHDIDELPKLEGWSAYRLPSCVLIPQVSGHSSDLLSSILGVSPARLEKLVNRAALNDEAYHEAQFFVVNPGTSGFARNQLISRKELAGAEGSGVEVDGGIPALRRRLSEIELPAIEPADAGGPGRFLPFFARHGIRPEWVCLTTIPLPGKDIRDPEVTATIVKLLKVASRFERLKALSAPQVILENEQLLLQRNFEDFYSAVKQSLGRLAKRQSPTPPAPPQSPGRG